ncbi:hypothetical protein FPOA_06319 [Fusarium poae]|uniref:Uncharacterized protein n=1 Tax=Fusarium poae TaxID=36050 RepID=A0A1B8AZ89_FUSPO|nr:hypothetical protein FPOA_06319 [Fusarium poae]
MAGFDLSVTTQPFNISVVSSNGTDQLERLIAPSWVSSPNIRGSMDIIQSCVLTLVACIYTALHLDVPRKTTWKYLLWQKSKWVCITLFAPEIAVYMAASQLRYAWSLKTALRKLQKEKQESNWTPDADFQINLQYAFFIIMGAVRFDVHDILSISDFDFTDRHYFQDMGPHRRTIQPGPAAIIRLAERGHWIQIRKQDIEDKSKSNTVSKTLVLVQVVWMVTQCIARRIGKLPISLLEIHTMVHVVCAVFLFTFWLKKPQNIQEAIVIQTEGFRGELAAMLQQQYYCNISHRMALFTRKEQEDQPPPIDANGSSMRWIEPDPAVIMYQGDILPSGLALSASRVEKLDGSSVYYLDPRGECSDTCFTIERQFLARWDAILTTFPFEGREKLAQESDKIMMQMIDESGEPQAVTSSQKVLYLPILEDLEPRESTDWNMFFWERKSVLHLHGNYEPDSNNSKTLNASLTNPDLPFWSWEFFALATTLSAIYGGIHLTIWGQPFPSYVEEIMWKASCFLIICWVPSIPVIYAILRPLSYVSDALEAMMDWPDATLSLHTEFLVLIYFISCLLYAAARVFVIIESFLSLRQVPVGVFLSPEWVELFPHF